VKALIVTDCDEQFHERLAESFNDYEVLPLSDAKDCYYEQARKLDVVSNYHPIFLFLKNPVLATIVACHLIRRVKSFYVIEWLGTRFRVLSVP